MSTRIESVVIVIVLDKNHKKATKTLQFYQQLFGFRFTARGHSCYTANLGNCVIEVVPHDYGLKPQVNMVLVDKVPSRLWLGKYKVVMMEEWNIQSFQISDQSGNLLMLEKKLK